jgi:hypothetical protein
MPVIGDRQTCAGFQRRNSVHSEPYRCERNITPDTVNDASLMKYRLNASMEQSSCLKYVNSDVCRKNIST